MATGVAVLRDPAFAAGEMDTRFVDTHKTRLLLRMMGTGAG